MPYPDNDAPRFGPDVNADLIKRLGVMPDRAGAAAQPGPITGGPIPKFNTPQAMLQNHQAAQAAIPAGPAGVSPISEKALGGAYGEWQNRLKRPQQGGTIEANALSAHQANDAFKNYLGAANSHAELGQSAGFQTRANAEAVGAQDQHDVLTGRNPFGAELYGQGRGLAPGSMAAAAQQYGPSPIAGKFNPGLSSAVLGGAGLSQYGMGGGKADLNPAQKFHEAVNLSPDVRSRGSQTGTALYQSLMGQNPEGIPVGPTGPQDQGLFGNIKMGLQNKMNDMTGGMIGFGPQDYAKDWMKQAELKKWLEQNQAQAQQITSGISQ